MANDPLAAMLAALDKTERDRRAASARTPDSNNPMRPAYQRPERRTRRPYADPVGDRAVGNIRKQERKK